jgi:E3 ubiquitin-protein ligase HECTD2
MPSWLFPTKKKAAVGPVAPTQYPRLPPQRKDQFYYHVSTMSSVGDIIRSVSEANAVITHTPEEKQPKLMVKQCVCCGTDLQVPEGIPYFKCSICETFHDLKCSPSSPTAAAKPISIQTLRSALEQAAYSKDLDGLDALLTCCFSSVDTINQSFSLGRHKPSFSKPNIDYDALAGFYHIILSAPSPICQRGMKTILTSLLGLVKRMKKTLHTPGDICFVMIILENPLFYKPSLFTAPPSAMQAPKLIPDPDPFASLRPLAIEVLERAVAILAHSSKECRHYVLNWLTRMPVGQFQPKVELLNAFVAHRLNHHYKTRYSRARLESYRHHKKSHSTALGLGVAAAAVAVTTTPSRHKKRRSTTTTAQIHSELYSDDWKINAFLKVLTIFFNANIAAQNKISVTMFYNTMVDCTDVTADFDEWQRIGVPTSSHVNCASNAATPLSVTIATELNFSVPRFAFCQYPFLLSMGSKTSILEYDARRQMEIRAQEAYFNMLERRNSQDRYFKILVRRDTVLQDSFDAFENHEDDLKKSLRIEFRDEPGIDAGGLKKEWFLLLNRELFDPSKGFYLEDEESRYCWFDPCSEATKYYSLTGVAVGLALYNSTILDLNFPPVVFKKLLGCPYSLDDFCELRPSHGRSLKTLLDYHGDDFEQVFALNFCVYHYDKTGKLVETPLIPNASVTSVTKSNCQDYVRRVVAHYLEGSVKRQFEAFKAGFYKVTGGNALSLFRPEEIELLIRGSPEPIDVDALRSVTKYQQWGTKSRAEDEDVIQWFWSFFANLSPKDQRKLLMFVTGSDRIPATGIATMPFRIMKASEDSDKLPQSYTCFNQLCLPNYCSREKLERFVGIAINESEGFGLK